MKTHWWKGLLPRCVHCNCTSLEAQHLQPESSGVGPCPLPHNEKLAERLLAEWVARQQLKELL